MTKNLTIFFILVILALGGLYFMYRKDSNPLILEQVACTMEAKICPDGTAVGRSGPNCEFAACPTPTTSAPAESDTAKLNQRVFNQGIYITPLKVISDSRCATGVTCIWAGTVSLSVKLESLNSPSENKEVTLTLENWVTFAGHRIDLKSVTPYPNMNDSITPDEYKFTFFVTPIEANNSEMIKVSSPSANQLVKSPLVVEGTARGNWYFEASFPVRLYDSNGKELAVTPAQAQGEWMTTEFVPFKATLNFSNPTTATGVLILEKDNPSGLAEFDDKISVPVKFR